MILNGDWVLDAAALASSILQCQVDNPYHEETKFCIWFGSAKDWGSCWLKTCVLFSQVHWWLMMCLVDYHAKSTIDACADIGLWLYRWATCLHWSGTYQQHWKLHSGMVMSLWLGTKSMLSIASYSRVTVNLLNFVSLRCVAESVVWWGHLWRKPGNHCSFIFNFFYTGAALYAFLFKWKLCAG